MKLRFLAPTQLELDEAFVWYETEHKSISPHLPTTCTVAQARPGCYRAGLRTWASISP